MTVSEYTLRERNEAGNEIPRSVKPNKNPGILRVFMVRHGRTEYNAKKIMQGHIDNDIDEVGQDQSLRLAKYVHDFDFDYCVTSDLSRCRSTVKDIIEANPKLTEENVRVTPNLRERMMGPVQGMYIQEAVLKYGSDFKSLGEKPEELIKRVQSEWDSLIDKAIAEDHRNTLFCTHGGVITGFTTHLYDSGYDSAIVRSGLRVPFNSSITVIDIDKETRKGKIQDFGVTDHLGGYYIVKNQDLR